MPKKKRFEYVGHLKFSAQQYDLTSIPDNETAMKDTAAIMPLIRMAAVLLTDTDRELTKKIRDGGDLSPWLSLLDQLVGATAHKKQEYELLEAGSLRLQIALERIVGKKTMERCYKAA